MAEDLLPDRDFSGEFDPIDFQLRRLGAAPARLERQSRWYARLGLSWSGGSVPVVLLLLLGAILGPGGLALLTAPVLTAIDPAVSVALAALGILVGLDLTAHLDGEHRRVLASAAVESLVTLLVAAAGIGLLLEWSTALGTTSPWLVALAAGTVASASSGLPRQHAGPAATALRVIDLDVIVPIVLGGVMLAWAREASAAAAALLLVQSVLIAIIVAGATWLLFSRTTSATEQLVFGAAALLLLGGIADFLSLSALLTGLVAGVVWGLRGDQIRERIHRDVAHLQRPFLVLLLVIAGAAMEPSVPLLVLAAAYLLLRVAGKLAGGAVARRLLIPTLPPAFGNMLLSPGVFAVAIALSLSRALPDEATTMLTVAVLGTVAAQLLWLACGPGEQPA